MMKITGLSHLFKSENLHIWWLTKYFFAPLYVKPDQCINTYFSAKDMKQISHYLVSV